MRNYVEAENVTLVYSGKNFFETLLGIIENAAECVHLQTYIFETDRTGYLVMDALKNAAQRGVRVYMMVDAYASFPFPASVADELHAAGVHFRLFSPLFSSESIFIGRRLHHKIVVADRKHGLVGGINIADKYNINSEENPWLDYAVLVSGDVCQYLHTLCELFFLKRKGLRRSNWEKRLQIEGANGTNKFVRFRRNDWIRGRNEIHKSYVEALIKAENRVTFVASYFLPGNNIRRLLRKATQRGVEVRVILAGKSDVHSMRLAEKYMYDYYLRNNIRVYEWHDSVLHGKAMVVDDTWATIGSYNLNFLSHYISIELNAEIIDKEFAGQFSAHLQDLISRADILVEIKPTLLQKNILTRGLWWVAYNFYRLLMGIALTGRNKQRRSVKSVE